MRNGSFKVVRGNFVLSHSRKRSRNVGCGALFLAHKRVTKLMTRLLLVGEGFGAWACLGALLVGSLVHS